MRIADNETSVCEGTLNDFCGLVRYAVMAPSGHNAQPWKFIIKKNGIEIQPDWSRKLSIVDPENRELYISLGCALENLCVAAASKGYTSSVSFERKEDESFSIIVGLIKAAGMKDYLFDAIEKRQTNRSKYDGRIVSDITIDLIKRTLGKSNHVTCYFYAKGTPDFKKLVQCIKEGNNIQMENSGFKEELRKWMRFNDLQGKRTRDGLSNKVMGFPGMPVFIGKLIIESQLKALKQNRSDVEKINSSSHLVLLTTTGNEVIDWIALGQTMERLLLEFTREHICNAFVNQPCEVVKVLEDICNKMFGGKEYPMILMRIGYSKPVPYSLRRDVKDVVSFENC